MVKTWQKHVKIKVFEFCLDEKFHKQKLNEMNPFFFFFVSFCGEKCVENKAISKD